MNKEPRVAAPGGGEEEKLVIQYVRAEDRNIKRFRIDPARKNVLVLSSPPYGVSK
jgi:hypothetical protein